MKKVKNLLYIAAFITTVFYLSWRLVDTIPWHDSWFALVFGLLLWLSELVSAVTGYVLILNKQKNFQLEKPEISYDRYPDVDVLIATHNEDPDLLYKTINACTFMEYPDKSKVRIYVCDDTNRPEVAKIADELGVGYFGLSDNKDAKSGNYNNALSKTSAPLVATFDADMIPYREFLMEAVPYFIEQVEAYEKGEEYTKPKIGLIQTPQSFYNADIFQYNLFSEETLPNEQDFFSKEINVFNNARGAAVYTGSNTVIFRKAIEDAGGFPVGTITEDFELGVRMNAAGYVNYSTKNPMASGLTPTDLKSVIKQRVRWGRGVIKSSYNMNVFFNPKLTKGQRLVYINGYLYWWSFFRRLLYILAPILFTVFHVRVVVSNIWLLFFFWLPSYALTRISMREVSKDYRTQVWGEIVETIFAPYLVIPLMLESFGISEKKFKVTRKGNDSSWTLYLYAIPYVILWGLAMYGLITFNYGKFGSELFYGSIISFWLMYHIVNLTFAIFCAIGRPIYRNSERFIVDEPMVIDVDGESYDVRVCDISETGISFSSPLPLYLPKTKELTLHLQSRNYRALAKGHVVRVVVNDEAKGWRYGVQFTSVEKADIRQFYQYIYDRINHNLPTKKDSWMTTWDDLLENFNQRFQSNERPESPYDKIALPKVRLNEEVDYGGQTRQLRKTNYYYMTFSGRLENPRRKPIVDFIYHDIFFKLAFVSYDPDMDESIYQVINLPSIEKIPAFKALANEWREKV